MVNMSDRRLITGIDMLHLREMFFGNDVSDIAPDEPLCVIGDIHGRLDLLNALLDRVDQNRKLVFVGDYLDRGPQSAQVINRLIGLQSKGRARCLIGNHEAMFLGFVDAPERGGGWLRSGGVETLASYGVEGVGEWADLEARQDAHRDLLKNLPLEHLAFLFSLKSGMVSGNVLISHAGANPSVPVGEQKWEDMVWGVPEFYNTRRLDGAWVVHGHTICKDPVAADGKVSVDTGAWRTGHLTAALIDTGRVRFVST